MKPAEKKLLQLFKQLSQNQQDTLLEFAHFLNQRSQTSSARTPQQPQAIERPEKESVVAALKRLSASYPMLDDPTLLNEGSALMSQHVIQGRGAEEVIDDMEAMFAKSYKNYLEQFESLGNEENTGC